MEDQQKNKLYFPWNKMLEKCIDLCVDTYQRELELDLEKFFK